MGIVKSGIATALLLTACTAYSEYGAQPLKSDAAPVGGPVQSGDSGQGPSLSARRSPIAPVEAPAIQPPPQLAGEVAFMKAQFNAIQPRSIAENREYCGYLGLLPNGDFAISGPRRGDPSGCLPDEPPGNMRVIASYHTHAAYAPRYDSEVPSTTDLESDFGEGINGYVATPGGRLWFNNRFDRTTMQVCSISCLISDPRFQPDTEFPVQLSYTLAALRQRQN